MTAQTTQPTLEGQVASLLLGDETIIQNPFLLYERLRTEAPVYRYSSESTFVSSYRLARSVMTNESAFPSPTERLMKFDDRFSRLDDDEREMYEEIAAFERLFISRRRGEDHRRYRAAMHRALVPRRVAEMRGAVQQIVDEILEPLAAQRDSDVIFFAYRVPLLVIIDLLGAPREDADRIKHWGDAVLASVMYVPLDPARIREGHARLLEYQAYASDLVQRVKSGGDRSGLVALLVESEENDRLSVEEMTATFLHFLFAGHETTTNLIASGLWELLSNRDQWDLLCSDPDAYAAGAVEETLRMQAPAQMSPRSAAQTIELGGVTIPAGSSVIVVEGAANRDPAAFPDPDNFDITRKPNDHLGLGQGPHFCIGAALARLEGQLALSTIARRHPGLELRIPPDEAHWAPSPRLRGLTSLPVNFG